jgi:hypothetical protein
MAFDHVNLDRFRVGRIQRVKGVTGFVVEEVIAERSPAGAVVHEILAIRRAGIPLFEVRARLCGRSEEGKGSLLDIPQNEGGMNGQIIIVLVIAGDGGNGESDGFRTGTTFPANFPGTQQLKGRMDRQFHGGNHSS